MALKLSRRWLIAASPFLLAACQSKTQQSVVEAGLVPLADGTPDYALAYAPVRDGGFSLPAIDYLSVDPKFLRQQVWYPTNQEPGTIVVDPANKFLYFIQPGSRAIRYGIGVGRAGFAWNGEAVIRFKRIWPKWFPPDEMIERDPSLEKYRDGQEGGPSNPIGARGLYLWQGNVDTLYRIHGTNQPQSIGTNASSGCIRMWHQDIIDLYERVQIGAKVVVLG
ncbi:L,D-transpeptidase [Roseibium denhamense]|uniref:Lipoprotein-anchoring transpeptidase ErfK/SrfK n=1 Tax=Roseibium denhamense TaxID=76305 RepID=A0ABY1P3M6_9HYPH|nr:L,D-transpeptidase [Roseibium denhamense]MTI07751.1 L,D-transpeptidase [Roseibium denhamense]SMP25180.1 Lipoprotein-anchoring transpeptidase ErfK/SrfK [Roseibium denhamense]